MEKESEIKESFRRDSIGTAKMRKDGTIVLHLRAEGPDGLVGDALIRVSHENKEYKSILEHLGGLKPGEDKRLPPWPRIEDEKIARKRERVEKI